MRDSYGWYVDQLQGEYKEAFKQVETYVVAQNIDEDTTETYMGELLDIFLNAQEESKPVEKIVGNDMEVFCRNFCSEFGWKNRAMRQVEKWRNIAWVILGLNGLDFLFILLSMLLSEDDVSNLWSTESTFNITGYIIGFVIIGLIYTIMDYVTVKVMFKMKKGSIVAKVWSATKVIVLVCCFSILFMMLKSEKTNFLALPSWVMVLGSGLFLVGYYIFNRDKVKERKANKISIWGMMQEEIKSDFPSQFDETMEKTFEKKNKRLLKRGKTALTKAEFIDLREKEMKKTLKQKWLYDWAPLMLTITMGIVAYFISGISTDIIILMAIIFVVETLIFKGVWKITSSAVKTNMVWIEAQRKTINENVEE